MTISSVTILIFPSVGNCENKPAKVEISKKYSTVKFANFPNQISFSALSQ